MRILLDVVLRKNGIHLHQPRGPQKCKRLVFWGGAKPGSQGKARKVFSKVSLKLLKDGKLLRKFKNIQIFI